jgi:hypothetical protein
MIATQRLDPLITPLNFTVNVPSLTEYYNTVVTQYDHKKWTWDRYGHEIVEKWKNLMMKDAGTLLPYGWAIQTTMLTDDLIPPPYNISIHRTSGGYRNTELSFGIVKRLQEAIPFAYRWNLVVQPPGGKVARHTDAGDEFTGHIPICDMPGAIFKFWDDADNRIDFPVPGAGWPYIVDTLVVHETENYGDANRVGIAFRFKATDLDKALSIVGEIS